MAKRKPPRRVGPPTPIVGARAQRERVRKAAEKRERESAARKRNLRKAARARKLGGAFEQTHAILERATGAEWSAAKARPAQYWDERWTFTSRRGPHTSWEDIVEFRYELAQNRTVTDYLASRAVSILVVVEDGESGHRMTLTLAAARDWWESLQDMEDKLEAWADKYGKEELGNRHGRILEIVFFLRRHGVHHEWPSVVHGRAKTRERLGLPPGSDF
jgi:hypothetical protein